MARFFQKYGYYALSIGRMMVGFRDFPAIVKTMLAKKLTRPSLVTLQNGVRYLIRGKMDLWSVKEAWLDRFYETYGYQIEPDWNIIDIGGGIGEFTIFASQKAQQGHVYAFEPFSSSYQLLINNLELNHVSNCTAIQRAVSTNGETILLDSSNGEPLQVQSLTDNHRTSNGIFTAVESDTLKDIFSKYQLSRCHLLKLDCEGAEYDILFKSGDVLNLVERIVLEYHHVNGHTVDELLTFLGSNGYVVETFPNHVHDHIGYLRAIRRELM